ncbi:class A beta-lactamase [Bradyrhizobium sp. sBnM-33]|uniref:class A beta-lactamase n=1 Tax=Bradyrhizobium sp. sBnM-33 TaxID=2831780 RepID=UPI001BD15C6F|nr:class A beta-lactamase [Bradyrhizobium sp. sBnM-33]WOH47797.1 class A beta-lactamase [Bradyrhizobium sp. sBnM-33]
MITRRQFQLGCGAALITTALSGQQAIFASTTNQRLIDEIKRLESESGGRLGVCVLETATGTRHIHRGDERFPMCSTFKVLAAAAILAGVDAGKELLTRRITFEASALVVNSPVTETRVGVGGGMTLAEICEAAVTRSDNTAGNLLLASIGGPPGLTAFARSLGDQVTRLDRDEPSLNEALLDDPRDTTTPNAMASNLQALILGTKALSAASREQLTAWLIANKTGDTRLRAGLAKDWRVGDKTGTGARGTNNDVAVIWPPGKAPIVITAYLTGATVPAAQQNATLASVARAVSAMTSG